MFTADLESEISLSAVNTINLLLHILQLYPDEQVHPHNRFLQGDTTITIVPDKKGRTKGCARRRVADASKGRF